VEVAAAVFDGGVVYTADPFALGRSRPEADYSFHQEAGIPAPVAALVKVVAAAAVVDNTFEGGVAVAAAGTAEVTELAVAVNRIHYNNRYILHHTGRPEIPDLVFSGEVYRS
jgi:hypothetical protein